MHRFTKIVATLGPASSDPKVLARLVAAGVDVVRLNFSYGTAAEHRALVRSLRHAANSAGRTVGIMADLQGPKIRVGKFAGDKVLLENNQPFVLDIDCELGDAHHVGLDYPELVDELVPGNVLSLNDGRIVLDVQTVGARQVHCRVRIGGELSNHKGINKQGGGLTAPALTAKDRDDIHTAACLNVDFVAVSFPRSGSDMRLARDLLRAAGSNALLIAKIERAEAVANLDEVLHASDGAMVARGDLAIEVGDACVPALQKRIIRVAREMDKFVITATQMMESMIGRPVPTRAEVSDVANAVLDGSDAVMLSAESATGQYPVETVKAMARICVEAEKSSEIALERHFLDRVFSRIDQSIAMAALFVAYHLKVKAIAALTESGSTPLWMSRLNSGVPIYALTRTTRTRYRVSLFRGVTPLLIRYAGQDRDATLRTAEQALIDAGAVAHGDLIVLTIGEPLGTSGGTNTMKIVRVGEHLAATGKSQPEENRALHLAVPRSRASPSNAASASGRSS